jgi:hypothetical protein
MNLTVDTSGWDPLLLVVGGITLLGLLLTAGRLLEILPANRSRRELVARLAPLVGMLVVLAYLLFAARKLFGSHPDSVPFAIVLLLFGFGAAASGDGRLGGRLAPHPRLPRRALRGVRCRLGVAVPVLGRGDGLGGGTPGLRHLEGFQAFGDPVVGVASGAGGPSSLSCVGESPAA